MWDGSTLPFSVHDVKLDPNGFRVAFTKPVNRKVAEDPNNFQVDRWGYHYHPRYGSPKVENMKLVPKKVIVSKNGKSVFLEMDLEKERVYKFNFQKIQTHENESLVNHFAWYTLNRLKISG
jgi:hypothetical protein